MDAAPYPNAEIALAGSIALLSGISGKAFNTYTGAGLNQYILLLAATGMGKEAIAGGISRLLASVGASVPSAVDFKGPGQIASAPGMIKWLDKKPCVVSIIGEFGLKLKAMSSAKASPNDIALKAVLLELYSKSGAGNILDPMAYSDVAKNTLPIKSPSLTIIGESVPGVFYETLDDGMVASGLLPRFMVIEVVGKRPYGNDKPLVVPPPQLVQSLANLCSQALSLASRNLFQVVEAEEEAVETFKQFEVWTTDQINGSSSEVNRQLWNRAHLKALKLASVQAVGMSYLEPKISQQSAMWATNLISAQTVHLLSKFDNGEIGEIAGNETKQHREIMRIIVEYVNATHARYDKYHGSFEMHRDGIITLPHIMQKLRGTAAFRSDRLGPTTAINRTIKLLLEGDQLREISKSQMLASYGSHPRAFAIAHPQSFMPTSPV